ncbi:MAG: hypothetical protein HPY50_04025 [Firmicutes bacterium]|nr:hypothetical protein [Bacillota bacterium]
MTSTFRTESINRIGGELELSPADFLRPDLPPLPRFFPQRNHLYLDTGRSAIYLALVDIIERGGRREAWLPRYHCPSVLMPFKLLGFKLNFYTCGSDLDSPSGLPEVFDGETFFFIHYFGQKNRAVCRYLESAPGKHFVIEDCVQSLLTQGVGKQGYSVYSFRKFLPLPDGALLASDLPLALAPIAPPDESFVSQRLIGKLIRNKGEEKDFLDLFAQAERMINRFTGPREMSFLSRYLLDRIDLVDVAERRRNNFLFLSRLLEKAGLDYELLHPLFDSIEPGEVPLGMPVVVAPHLRDRLREYLILQKIYCPVHWPLGSGEGTDGIVELKLSRSLLTLPVDQGQDSTAMAYLIEKVTYFFNAIGKYIRELSDASECN